VNQEYLAAHRRLQRFFIACSQLIRDPRVAEAIFDGLLHFEARLKIATNQLAPNMHDGAVHVVFYGNAWFQTKPLMLHFDLENLVGIVTSCLTSWKVERWCSFTRAEPW